MRSKHQWSYHSSHHKKYCLRHEHLQSLFLSPASYVCHSLSHSISLPAAMHWFPLAFRITCKSLLFRWLSFMLPEFSWFLLILWRDTSLGVPLCACSVAGCLLVLSPFLTSSNCLPNFQSSRELCAGRACRSEHPPRTHWISSLVIKYLPAASLSLFLASVLKISHLWSQLVKASQCSHSPCTLLPLPRFWN